MGDLNSELFWAVHRDLPREGPGDTAATLRAFRMMPDLPPDPTILDVGCGPGAQTVTLAQASRGRLIAVDTHRLFLDDLVRRTKWAGVSQRVHPARMSMFNLGFSQGFDVVWSEGAIYIMGFEEGLRAWRAFLKPGGYAAVTEVSWLKPDPAPDAVAFWAEAYPKMASVEGNLSRVRRAGYRPIGHFTLPQSAWWGVYFTPMLARIAELRDAYRGNPEAQAILDEEAAETDLYRQHADDYGYVFYVMQME